MGELPAAALCAQLDGFDAIQARRHLIWSRYQTELAPWAATNGVELPAPHPHSLHSAHLFHLVLPDASARERLLHHLGDQGVEATFHYIPLHTSPYGRRLCGIVHLPVTESVAGRLVRLPLYPDLGDDEVARVIDAVTDFRC
jgi:dTDP-4-amino-4,6-dideoxygalactose transaminase